jgi:5'-3' exonuclease
MGIKHFFLWFKNNFNGNIKKMKKKDTFESKHIDIQTDNLLIDMNGIFHNSAQKIYEYGNFKPRYRGKNTKRIVNHTKHQALIFKDVCETIEDLLRITKPNKRLIMCVDGPAPFSKQTQQRQRRFRSAMESEDDPSAFDSTCISPGTEFMDSLNKYIDWYIRKRISENEYWQSIDVIFSDEKVAGEGEHCLLSYVRQYGDPKETYCLQGLDADLIMLALGTQYPSFYILREDLYDRSNAFFVIDIGKTRDKLSNMMEWKSEKYIFKPKTAVNDFIFMCFTVGNDFLPHIPSLEIIENGIETLLDVYKKVCSGYGHLTRKNKDKIVFVKSSLRIFMGTIAQYEKQMFEEKMSRKKSFFPDELVEKHCEFVGSKHTINMSDYRKEYMSIHFPGITETEICHKYLEGMQWVLSYYTRGVPSWKWNFPYHYAPFAYNLTKHIKSFKFVEYEDTTPSRPYQQLLSILPPKSAKLLPKPLSDLLTTELSEYCPKDITIDLSGKRKEWEGIVLLPMVDYDVIRKVYLDNIKKVDERFLSRNTTGENFIYSYSSIVTIFKSYYGDIYIHKVNKRPILIE